MTVDYLWMENESGLDVIGDGATVYKFEGITNNPDDVWDADETYPGGYKIANAVKGTRIRDLCERVGGMGAGTEIVLVAKDGFETRLPYSSIYTDPSVQARQGDAILAWWADGKYVPHYRDGMRLFFTRMVTTSTANGICTRRFRKNTGYYFHPGDNLFILPAPAYRQNGLQESGYTPVPQGDWTLELDGRDIGGLHYDMSKPISNSARSSVRRQSQGSLHRFQRSCLGRYALWFLAGFVDDDDQHSNDAFNDELARAGYQVVITAEDGHSVTIDSADIIRNSEYIVANSLNGVPIPESDSNWPLRLVGPAVTGSKSISQIVRIELVSSEQKPIYTVIPEDDAVYTIGETVDGINTMTVNDGMTGLKYFTVNIAPEIPHSGYETAVFTHLRNSAQLAISAIRADFDQVGVDFAQAGFNVQPDDVIKVYLVDELNNLPSHNPIILQ